MEKKRVSKTPEQKLASLLAKQKSLAEQINRQKKLADKREREALEEKVKRASKFIVDAGLLDVPEPQLIEELKKIADRITSKSLSDTGNGKKIVDEKAA